MIDPSGTALILLAAGRSTRFGAADKLTAPLLGRPLAMHAVTALASVPFARRIAVVGSAALDVAAHGYQPVRNDTPETGLSGSIRLGVEAARRHGVDAILIALADMPRVTGTHVAALFSLADGPDTIVASGDGMRRSPPALFGQAWFDRLTRLEGDEGARHLLRDATIAMGPPGLLTDIDRPEDLRSLLP